jgi:tripartite-type tricarboxylate transporter receptor subunit TctC
MNEKSLFIYALVVFFTLGFSSISGAAPVFPTKPITIICGYAPGGSADLPGRMLANKATELLGKPVVVVNKPAGAGYAAATEVFHAEPDGHTLALLGTSTTSYAPLLRKAPFDPWKMTPIMGWGGVAFVLAVKKDAQWKTLKEFIEFIKNNPGVIKVASIGPDSMQSLVMLILKQQEKLNFNLVPFEGGAPGVAATLGGHTHAWAGTGEALSNIREGTMRGLATFGPERIPRLPDIPTLKELGFRIEAEALHTIWGPPGVPKDVVKKLEETFKKAMNSEDFEKLVETFHEPPTFYDSEKLDKNNREAYTKFKDILIKTGRIKE